MFIIGAAVLVPSICSAYFTLDQGLNSLSRTTGLSRDELGTVALWLAIALVVVCVVWFVAEGMKRPD
jgi:hypothetical protein